MSEVKDFSELAQIVGNILATKNQIAINIWITDTIEIPCAISHKQNRLRNGFWERVGITRINPEILVNTGLSGFYFCFEYTKGTR